MYLVPQGAVGFAGPRLALLMRRWSKDKPSSG
jgi:hypothetical protein